MRRRFFLVSVAKRTDQRVAIRLKSLKVGLVAVGDVIAEVFHAHFELSDADFEAAFLFLQLDELLPGGTQSDFDGFRVFVNLRARGKKPGDLGFERRGFLLPDGYRFAQAAAFRVERFDAGLVAGDVGAARFKKFGKLREPGGHGSALAVQVVLLLAFGSDADPNFIQFLDGSAFALARGLGGVFGFRSPDSIFFERLGGFRDRRFQVFEVREAGAKRLSELHGFLDIGGATVLEIGQLALGELVLVLDRCALDLRALKAFPGRKEAVLGGFERLQGICSGGCVGFQFPYRGREFAFELGNLCPPGKSGMAGIFAGLAAADNALRG